jgi:1-deoxy-D-xylulose-5-phosphate reductoisomerase
MSVKPDRLGIAVLGSTGSVGRQTLDVIAALPERFRVVALAGRYQHDLLADQVRQFRPDIVVAADRQHLAENAVLVLPEGLTAAATHPDVDIVVVATTGHDAIVPTIEAIKAGKTIALANKEVIVCAGALIMPLARARGVQIRPVDSEHSAIWQSLAGAAPESIGRLIVTASGGPFRGFTREQLAAVTVEQALAHPTWHMGPKISLDSATLMNKGLELIEAHWFFDVPFERIDVVVHPQSIVHSMVEFVDRSVVAQLGNPDMRLPIQYALTYPERVSGLGEHLDFASTLTLTFEAPDIDRFPALRLAREAGEAGQTLPTVLSAVDEVAVDAFTNGRIRFLDIARLVEMVMERHTPSPVLDVGDVLDADRWARDEATRILRQIAG